MCAITIDTPLCRNALEAFDALHTQAIDLVFLDIQMPAITGIDLIRSLKAPPRRDLYHRPYRICGYRL